MNQKEKILQILSDRKFHCVNEFIDIYCVDYRRRLKDIQEGGRALESKKCELHNFHKRGSKMWRIMPDILTPKELPKISIPFQQKRLFEPVLSFPARDL